jgi:opacity protein-like surface antigen
MKRLALAALFAALCVSPSFAANAIYPIYKQALLDGLSDIDINDGTVKVALIDTADYTYSAAHDFYNDVSVGTVGTPQTIANTTVTTGLFDGDNVTFTAGTGDPCEALVIYIDTGNAATSRLVAYLDTGVTGLPVTPNGGDIVISWHASGIFQL